MEDRDRIRREFKDMRWRRGTGTSRRKKDERFENGP